MVIWAANVSVSSMVPVPVPRLNPYFMNVVSHGLNRSVNPAMCLPSSMVYGSLDPMVNIGTAPLSAVRLNIASGAIWVAVPVVGVTPSDVSLMDCTCFMTW